MVDAVRYEVILVPSDSRLTSSDWTWRRIEQDGGISAHGLRHDTMKACFAEVRDHKTVFGDAAVTVNLRGDGSPAAVEQPAPGTAERTAPVLGRSLKRRFNRHVALGR